MLVLKLDLVRSQLIVCPAGWCYKHRADNWQSAGTETSAVPEAESMTEGVCCVTEAVFVTEAERGRRFRVLPAMLEHAVGRAGGGFFSKKQDKVLPLPHCLDFKVAGGFDVDARARCCCVDRQSTASQSQAD